MKIVGGNFGVSGSAFISQDNMLVVEGAKHGVYSKDKIRSINASVVKEKKFGILGFLLGILILGAILGFFFGLLGVIAGVVIAIAGSFYTEKSNIVEIQFLDGSSVTLDCTPRGVKKLFAFHTET